MGNIIIIIVVYLIVGLIGFIIGNRLSRTIMFNFRYILARISRKLLKVLFRIEFKDEDDENEPDFCEKNKETLSDMMESFEIVDVKGITATMIFSDKDSDIYELVLSDFSCSDIGIYKDQFFDIVGKGKLQKFKNFQKNETYKVNDDLEFVKE